MSPIYSSGRPFRMPIIHNSSPGNATIWCAWPHDRISCLCGSAVWKRGQGDKCPQQESGSEEFLLPATGTSLTWLFQVTLVLPHKSDHAVSSRNQMGSLSDSKLIDLCPPGSSGGLSLLTPLPHLFQPVSPDSMRPADSPPLTHLVLPSWETIPQTTHPYYEDALAQQPQCCRATPAFRDTCHLCG